MMKWFKDVTASVAKSIEAKQLAKIEEEAKLLILPLFQDQPKPVAEASVKQDPAIFVFKLDQDGEVNYPFFTSDRISEESKPEYMEVVEQGMSIAPYLTEAQVKTIVNVFANYQDVCRHFFASAYGSLHAGFICQNFSYSIMEAITLTTQVCNTKEIMKEMEEDIDHSLLRMKESGDTEDVSVSVKMAELDPLTKVFSYITYTLTISQTRYLHRRFPMHNHVNTIVEHQMNRLGKIFREVLCSLHDRIGN